MTETLGQYLKREREFRQIGLDEVATATRVGLNALTHIEQNSFAQLPGEVFVRGYLKAYARHIGLDPADVILRYEDWLKVEAGPEEPALGELKIRKASTSKRNYLWALLLAAAIIGLAAYLASL